jgi:lipoprotein-anchoring transpeptidase ErfK/SrfK
MKRHAATALLVASFLPLLPLVRPAAAIEPQAAPRALPPLPPLNQPASATTAAPRVPAQAPAPVTAAATTNREIVLELRKRTISLMEGGKVLGKWPVAIGDPSTPTPTGRYSIRNKVVNPQYQSTKTGKNNPTIGPNGPLGDRWLGFHATARDQFGIHGTPPAWAWSVQQGAAVTHGCVRMLGSHVRALFDQVDVGTPVTVKP